MERLNTLKARQIRAARALSDWSQEDLASVSGLSVATIRKLELGHISPRGRTTKLLRRAFEASGLEFLEPDGVRHRPEEITVYQGRDGYVEFFDDVYEFARKKGGEIVIVVASEVPFNATRGHGDTSHIDRMEKIKDRVNVKCIVTENTDGLLASKYCEYRQLSKHFLDSVPFYVYDNKYAAIMFDADPSPKIIVIQSLVMSQSFRRQFNSMWEKARPLVVSRERKKVRS